MKALEHKDAHEITMISVFAIVVCAVAFGSYFVLDADLFFWSGVSSAWLLIAFLLGFAFKSLSRALFAPRQELTDTWQVPAPLMMMFHLNGVLLFTSLFVMCYPQVSKHVGDVQLSSPFIRSAFHFTSIALIFSFILIALVQSKREKKALKKVLINASGEIMAWKGNKGKILLDQVPLPRLATRWKVTSDEIISVGDRVKVTGMDKRLKTLEVARLASEQGIAPARMGKINYALRALFLALVVGVLVWFFSFALMLLPFYVALP